MSPGARYRAIFIVAIGCSPLVVMTGASAARAQQTSISAWEAADFRVWGFVPYWTPQTQLNGFPADGIYNHVSDVLYFSGVRPMANGNLNYHPNANGHLTALKAHAAQHGFRFHMSMFDTAGGDVETVWNSITGNATNRANFVNNVKNLLLANNMTGFNLDWERPNTVTEWANYTQLAKDLRAAFDAQGLDFEISVDDYGFASSQWDDTPVFDARTYDQLFIMGYHYPAFGNGSLNNNNFANTKLNLVGQGADKAFKNEQLVIGIGTWGANGPATVSLKNIVAVNPNLPADALTFTGTVADLNGTLRTGTWDIESRYQVREKTQLALDRNMAGMMSWTLHYDAINERSLHRVMHHYIVVKRGVPDLNLDGRVNAVDANVLADNMGTVPGWKGTATAAQFESFYISGNWEKGDRDGNGFVNQQDADWLAGRFGTLGVALPDRLAYTGTFEEFQDGAGLSGRWEAVRGAGGQLPETGNYTQHGAGLLSFTGTGAGAGRHSDTAVTLRNQNAAEAFDAINAAPREMRVGLAVPIDLAQQDDTYFTFLVRQNSAPLLASQVNSLDRTLSLEFFDAAGQSQFDFALFGQQQQFAIRHQADAVGDDAWAEGFATDTTYLFVGKIAGNGTEANTLQASLFAEGAAVGKFTDPSFEWMLTAESSPDFNPVITQLQFASLYEANYTVSNVWTGGAHEFFAPTPADMGDFNEDGMVDAADYVVWRRGLGTIYTAAHYNVWRIHYGEVVDGGSSAAIAASIPEPAAFISLLPLLFFLAIAGRFRGLGG